MRLSAFGVVAAPRRRCPGAVQGPAGRRRPLVGRAPSFAFRSDSGPVRGQGAGAGGPRGQRRGRRSLVGGRARRRGHLLLIFMPPGAGLGGLALPSAKEVVRGRPPLIFRLLARRGGRHIVRRAACPPPKAPRASNSGRIRPAQTLLQLRLTERRLTWPPDLTRL